MATLNHDSAGFLLGPRLTDDLDKISRELELLRAIRGDTQETVEQLGRLVDVLSDLDSVTPAEPGRPPAPVSGPDAPPAAIDVTVVVQASPNDAAPAIGAGMPSGADVSAPTPIPPAAPGVNLPARAPLDTGTPSVADPRVERFERERRQRPPENVRAERQRPPGGVRAEQKRAPENASVKRQRPPEGARAERQRGADGRFGSAREHDDDRGESRTAKAMGAASESLTSVAEGLSSGADNVDPTVTAAKELGSIVAPVMGAIKPLGRLFGMGRSPDDKRQRQNVTWYRRIWGELRESNKRSGGRGMGMLLAGLMSMLGMLLAPLRALARLTGLARAAGMVGGLAKGLGGMLRGRSARVRMRERASRRAERRPGVNDAASPRAGRGRVDPAGGTGPGRSGLSDGEPGGRPGRGGSSRLGRTAAGIGRAGKGLLRKIPVIGALLGAGMFANAAMAKDDPSATPEERQANKTDRWGTMGGVVGGVLGGALGMFGGPAGAILGGMLGDQLGTAVGEWLSTVDMDGMLASIKGAWTTVTDGVYKLAGDAFTSVKEGWTSLVASGAKVFTGMVDWAKETWSRVSNAFLDARDTFRDKVQDAKDYVSDKAASVRDVGENALNKVTGGRYTGGSNARKAELIKAMDEGGITDPKSKAALMANVDHESGGFKSSEENLNYSAKRLQEVFPKYYPDAASARADANNPEAIANRVYGGRMGNTEAGDGFKYRGRGDIQLTGKAQYAAMGKKLGIDLVNNPELASDPRYAAQIAVQHWKDSGANAAAARGGIVGARKRTNGGTNGLADVEAKYGEYLAQAKAGDLTPTRKANEVRVAAPAPAMDAIKQSVATVKGRDFTSAPVVTSGPVGVLAMPTATTADAAGPAGAGVPVTPLAPMAAKPGTAQPIGVMAIPPATVAPVSPAANPGSMTTRPPAIMTTAAPAAPAPLKVPSYSAPAPDASQQRIAATPQVAKPLAQPNKAPAPPAPQMLQPLTQNLGDRAIAHAATGGIGMGGRARL